MRDNRAMKNLNRIAPPSPDNSFTPANPHAPTAGEQNNALSIALSDTGVGSKTMD